MPRKDPGMPYDLAPMLKARFGQPDDCADLVNKYGVKPQKFIETGVSGA